MKLPYALQLLAVVLAWAGLLASLFLLEAEPLFGVLGILGASALLVRSLASLFEGSSNPAISLED